MFIVCLVCLIILLVCYIVVSDMIWFTNSCFTIV